MQLVLPQLRKLLSGLPAGRLAKGGYGQEVMALGYSIAMATLMLYLLEIYTSIFRDHHAQLLSLDWKSFLPDAKT